MSVRGTLLLVIFLSVVVVIARNGADRGSRGNSVSATAPVTIAADGEKIVEEDMHEFMEYVFQPTYRRLKASMGEAPADNKGWKAIKSDSLILAESCNLLFARTPEVDGDDWNRHAAASRDAGAKLYAAGRSKDFEAATQSWKLMLNNCNACHRQFEDGKHILAP
ncbi:MAG: hypothetical protein Fues2KO_02120 [Fuerstiella sp.]